MAPVGQLRVPPDRKPVFGRRALGAGPHRKLLRPFGRTIGPAFAHYSRRLTRKRGGTMRRMTWLVGNGLLVAGPGYAEEKLALIIPEIFGSGGLKVDSASVLPNGQTHSAHFNGAFPTQFTQFNVALASQLTSLPVPSPASGFSYTFDASLGLFSRTTDSFGPILTDRADTAGKKKLSAGVSYQHFGFDTIEGVPLDDIPAVFTHDNP